MLEIAYIFISKTMGSFSFEQVWNNLSTTIVGGVEYYLPLMVGALVVLAFGILTSVGTYKAVMYFFKRFKIVALIDKLNIEFGEPHSEEEEIKRMPLKLSSKIKIDNIVSKAFAYYIFLVFFRLSIVIIGITEVEIFLGDLISYLPSLFVGIIIGFFGIRFANFIYDVVYHTLNLTKQKTSKIIASGAKIIILFFTMTLVLKYIKIVDPFIINTILVGFISMLTIAGGLAFGLGGKEVAQEILESLKK